MKFKGLVQNVLVDSEKTTWDGNWYHCRRKKNPLNQMGVCFYRHIGLLYILTYISSGKNSLALKVL